MSQAKMYVLSLLMRHSKTGEHRLVTDVDIAAGEQEALIKASLLAHPGQGEVDHWTVLRKQVEEVERGLIERAATDVLGWSKPEGQ